MDRRLIDANALAKWLDKEHYVDKPTGKCDARQNRVLGICISALKNPQIAPTIDAVPVVHGQWLRENIRPKSYLRVCSMCKKTAYFCGEGCSYKYCPNCGAKMDAKDTNVPTKTDKED